MGDGGRLNELHGPAAFPAKGNFGVARFAGGGRRRNALQATGGELVDGIPLAVHHKKVARGIAGHGHGAGFGEAVGFVDPAVREAVVAVVDDGAVVGAKFGFDEGHVLHLERLVRIQGGEPKIIAHGRGVLRRLGKTDEALGILEVVGVQARRGRNRNRRYVLVLVVKEDDCIVRALVGVVGGGSRAREVVAVVLFGLVAGENGNLPKGHLSIRSREGILEVERVNGFVHHLGVGQPVFAVGTNLVDAVQAGQGITYPIDGGVVAPNGQEVQAAVLANGGHPRNGQTALLHAGLVEANNLFGGLVHDVEQFVKAYAEVRGMHKACEGGLNGHVGNVAHTVIGDIDEAQVSFSAKVALAADQAQRGGKGEEA